MIKNNKGSGLTWAVMIVMILLLIIGASLTFAYSSYNRSIDNRNQLQCDLYAKSALDSLIKAIGDNETDLIPKSSAFEDNIYPEISLPNAKGEVFQAVIHIVDKEQEKDNDKKIIPLIYIEITYEYNGRTSNVQAVMQKIGGIWKVINYDGGEAA